MVPEKWSEINNFLSLWGMFCPFTPLVTQKIKISKKWKKGICTKNQDHNMYASWDVECGRHNFLLFCAIFCPFTLLTIQKIKILKKNAWRYYPFIHMYHKWRSCDVWLLRYKDFYPSPPPPLLTNWKMKINTWRYYFTHVHHKQR